VYFLQQFRQYLLSGTFTLQTDHGALTWLQQFKEPEGQLARWLEKLQGYHFTIVHHPGRKHTNADSLSHYPCRQCGRESHLSEQMISTVVLSEAIGAYSSQNMRDFQLDDNCVGPILGAIEANQEIKPDQAKGQSLEYRRLLQQRDKLIVHNGVLWRC